MVKKDVIRDEDEVERDVTGIIELIELIELSVLIE